MKKQDIAKVYQLDLHWDKAQKGVAESQYHAGLALERYARLTAYVDKEHYLKLAFDMYLKAAEQGFMDAQYKLGLLYQEGAACVNDEETAVHWFRKAYEQGHLDAPIQIAKIYGYSKNGLYNLHACQGWIGKAKELGNTNAMTHLALMYLDDDFIACNKDRGMKILQKEQPTSTLACLELGLRYQYGERVNVDWEASFRCFEEGYQFNDPACTYELAMCYRDGIGTPVNKDKFVNTMTEAAYLDHPQALKLMIEHYLQFPNDKDSVYTAEELCDYELDNGFGNHFHMLAACYENPQNKVCSWHSAREAYSKADQTLPSVCYKQGLFCLADDERLDYAPAMEYLLAAAEGGLDYCHELIAYLYKRTDLRDSDKASHYSSLPCSQPGKAFHDLSKIIQCGVNTYHWDYSDAIMWMKVCMDSCGLEQSDEYDALVRMAKGDIYTFAALDDGCVVCSDDGKRMTVNQYICSFKGRFHVYDVTVDDDDKVYNMFELIPSVHIGRGALAADQPIPAQPLATGKKEAKQIFHQIVDSNYLSGEGILNNYDLFEANHTLYILSDKFLDSEACAYDVKTEFQLEPLSQKKLTEDQEFHVPAAFTELETIDYGIDLCRMLLPLHEAGIPYGPLTPDTVFISKTYGLHLPDIHLKELKGGQVSIQEPAVSYSLEDDLKGIVSVLRFMRKDLDTPLLDSVLDRVLADSDGIFTLEALDKAFKELKKDVTPDDYHLINEYSTCAICNRAHDFERAVKIFMRMVESGGPDGYFYISQMYQPYDPVGWDDQENLLKILKKGMKSGSAQCAATLAETYYSGMWDGQPDYVKMYQCLSAETYTHDWDSYYLKGLCHEYGLGTSVNLELARDCYEKSGTDRANIQLGYMYEFAKGVNRDVSKAVEYYYEAVRREVGYERCVVNGRLEKYVSGDENIDEVVMQPGSFGYDGQTYDVPDCTCSGNYTMKSFLLIAGDQMIHTNCPGDATLYLDRHEKCTLSLFSDRFEWKCAHRLHQSEADFLTTLYVYKKGNSKPFVSARMIGYKEMGIHADVSLVSEPLIPGDYFIYMPGAAVVDGLAGTVQLDAGLVYPLRIQLKGQLEHTPVLNTLK